MKSLFVRLALWILLTAAVCIAGFSYTKNLRSFSPSRADFLSRFLEFQVAEARRAYREDGPAGLRDFFVALQKHFPGKYALLDQNGRNVLTGADASDQLRRAQLPLLWRSGSDKLAMIWPDRDQRYYLSVETVFPAGPPQSVPFYVWLVIACVGFCLIPIYQFASPLRTLSQTVEKFGVGELNARVNLKAFGLQGNDELGRLGRAFNVMANRIQMLLNAERRLLLDVSHELRSPLARLKFAVQLARTSPDRQHWLQRIEVDIDRLTVLVSELLQVTRAESDPSARASQLVNLNSLLGEVAEAGAFETLSRHCRLKLSVDEPVVVQGDVELLHRAIENVVRNAIRFAPEGTEVDIALARRNAGTALEQAVIAIRDAGPGVPEESIESLFKPFFRVEADRNRRAGGGFGLGLSIAERAVAVHGGSISARNAHPGLLVEIVLPNSTRADLPSASSLKAMTASAQAGSGG